jgi:HTH-type transcriptional repressor of NAD biosynthesis genes
MIKKYTHGFVVGKFMPLHAGHIFLLETAQARCQKLTVLIFMQPDDPIPGDIRLGWITEKFPDADVICNADILPRDQSGSKFWDIWMKSIEEHCQDRKFEAVFSSETYGQRLARDLGAEHVEVDPNRIKHPVSGSSIRDDPEAHMNFVPESVRSYYREQLS